MGARSGAKQTGHLLKQLRALMKNKQHVSEPLNAYIIPTDDAHQSEYIAPRDKRREFISGFTGSTGTAIVTEKEALLWADGRYFLQAESELDENWTLMKDGLPTTLKQEEWLSKNLGDGAVIGVDPYLLSLDRWRKFSQALKATNKSLIRVDENLVDLVWRNHGQPEPTMSELIALDDQFSGKPWKTKVRDLQQTLKSKECYAVVVAALDEVAWLFNMRASDIAYNPVFVAYAIVTQESASLFVDPSRLTTRIRVHLCLDESGSTLRVLSYERIQEELRGLAQSGKRIWISSKASCALASLVPEANLVTDPSPVASVKAVKNQTEIEGMRKAHIRDAAAVCEYLCWLETEIHKGYLTECTAADKLDRLRSEQEHFVSLSFPTISSGGPNAAIIHYRPQEESARLLSPDEIYLVDSGGQYLDGTTDVTRTLHFGSPTQHEKECFTRVLKGHIALAKAVFPKGVVGHTLDILARKALWDCGLDYLHGTGHGVGAFLNVHEGPIGISPRVSDDPPLEAGNFLSDEPGYYEDGKFGIRIENVVLVKNVELKFNFKEKGYLGFEPVTLVPIQSKMLVPELLTQDELSWINDYHSACAEKVGEHLRLQGKAGVLAWLIRETQALG